MNFKMTVFARLCSRCRETAQEAGAPQVLADIYQAVSAQPLQRFTALMKQVARAQTRANNATRARARALREMDSHFLSARAALRVIDPARVLPATLKAQATDTDKRDAVEELVEALAEHAGEAWADNLAQGEFGQKAAATIQALDEHTAARDALQKAKAERAAAFKPAWAAYLSFKRLVGSTLGKASRQHQRLRIRDAAAAEDDDAEGGEGGGGESGGGEKAPPPRPAVGSVLERNATTAAAEPLVRLLARRGRALGDAPGLLERSERVQVLLRRRRVALRDDLGAAHPRTGATSSSISAYATEQDRDPWAGRRLFIPPRAIDAISVMNARCL